MRKKDIVKQLVKLSAMVFAACQIGMVYAQTGPVATSCQQEIEKFCKDVPHDGSVRDCLEKNKTALSKECNNALETTGHGVSTPTASTVVSPTTKK